MIIEDTESFENVFVSNYWYDADGERTVKTSGENIRRKRSHLCQPILSCRARWRVHQAYLHCRAGRKSFSEQFSISAHGESRFPNGLKLSPYAETFVRSWSVCCSLSLITYNIFCFIMASIYLVEDFLLHG